MAYHDKKQGGGRPGRARTVSRAEGTADQLRELLARIDHRGYPAYKDLTGQWDFAGYTLVIDHVQGDPFASPSSVHVEVSGKKAGFPESLYDRKWKKTALEDHLLRLFDSSARAYSFRAGGSGKSGLIESSRPGQEVLERSMCHVDPADGSLFLGMKIGFPAHGRTIDAKSLEKILFVYLPECVQKTLFYRNLDTEKLQQAIDLADDQHFIREEMGRRGLIVFAGNGSILPRRSGVSQLPMKEAVPFQSPASLEVEMELPHRGLLRGMGIRKGITLIVGGGYHGKSTLLDAIMLGVYDHIAGDGREYVLTDASAMKIRAEDGRIVEDADISMFINHLPGGTDSRHFSTENASGSTSQAANITEAIQAGAGVFLIDEDTSATNFMMRDALMRELIPEEKEPITPFLERISEIYAGYGISTILVAGSFGAYFEKADTILQMDSYEAIDITARAKEIAAAHAESQKGPDASAEQEASFMTGKEDAVRPVRPLRLSERSKLRVSGKEGFSIDRGRADLRYVEQIADPEQATALAYITQQILTRADGKKDLIQLAEETCRQMEKEGFKALYSGHAMPQMAMPRKLEICAAASRFRRG